MAAVSKLDQIGEEQVRVEYGNAIRRIYNLISKYFKHNNIFSFIRQLNIYGFQKVRTEENQHFYRHQNFIKNNKRKLKLIQRKHHKLVEQDKNYENELLISESFKSTPEINSAIGVLQQENKKILKKNENLEKQILHLKQENKKQIENILYFLTVFVSHFKQNHNLSEQQVVSGSEQSLTHMQQIKKEILLLKNKQVTFDNINFQRIFGLLETSEFKVQQNSVSNTSKPESNTNQHLSNWEDCIMLLGEAQKKSRSEENNFDGDLESQFSYKNQSDFLNNGDML